MKARVDLVAEPIYWLTFLTACAMLIDHKVSRADAIEGVKAAYKVIHATRRKRTRP